MGPASGNQSSSAGSKSASVHRGSSGSPLRTLSPVVPTSEKFVCRESTGPFLFTHLCSYTCLLHLQIILLQLMPLLSVLLHHQSHCKIKLLLTLLVLPVNLHHHISLHRPLGVKFTRALHLIMVINCVTYNCRGWNSGSVTISDFIDLFDICFIQEHWLLADQLHILSSYHPDFAVSVSGINDDEFLSGRPYDGCAILYRSSLSSLFYYSSSLYI